MEEKKIHILGICGTFMGGIAILARKAGYQVSGMDANVYPPMSTQLEEQGIDLIEGFESSFFEEKYPNEKKIPIVIGNALSRGNSAVEYILENGYEYTSGPQWLAENVLKDRWVLAVSGTHGKTTTSSMLAWILEYAGLNPGFLIGGVPGNFGVSARFGDSKYFVVEADEYDTAFFDKRSKFVHYRPRTLIINNIEYDHADIFPDIAAIQRQFHHLVRTVPGNGLIITKNNCVNIDGVIQQGCWTKVQRTAISAKLEDGWHVQNKSEDGSEFDIYFSDKHIASIKWDLQGDHNIENGLSAFVAATDVGIHPSKIAEALMKFKGVKRRMEVRGKISGITVYDDFAHHPTAIKLTINGLRASKEKQKSKGKIIAIFEPRSNTMKMGVHKETLVKAFSSADEVYMMIPDKMGWSVDDSSEKINIRGTVTEIVEEVSSKASEGDQILIMSNGSFDGIHEKLLGKLKEN